jgi:hypothetical protein
MHIGLGGLVILVIVIAAVFGGPRAVGRMLAGLGCLATIVIAGLLVLWLLSLWAQHENERNAAAAGMSPSPTPFVVPPEDHQRALDAGMKDISPLKRFVYRSIEVLLYQQDGHYFYALIVPTPAKIRDKIKNYPSQMMLPNGTEIPDSN